MKVFKVFEIVILLVLFSCNNSADKFETMNAILEEAYSIYQHPDGERFDTYNDTIQLLPRLMEAAGFFTARHDNKNAAKAFLLCGYAQMESEDKISAMKSFKDAEHYGKISGDSLTTARAQFNVARMLHDEEAYNESLDIALAADINFGNHFDEKCFVYNLIASSYYVQRDFKNAESNIQKAMNYAEKGFSIKSKQKIINNLSTIYREQGLYEQSISCLRQNKNEADSSALLMFYLNTGVTYVYSSDYDSAAFYMKKALNISKSAKIKPDTEASIYFMLSYIYEKQCFYSQSLDYYKKYTKKLYNIQKERENKNLYKIQKQYDYEVLQNQMRQKIIGKQRIILIVSFLLLLASIFVIGLLLRQKKILEENERIRKELDETKAELQKSVRPEMAAKELSRQLHLIITANNIADTADDFKKEWSTLVYRINNEKNSKFEAALDAIEHVYPDMYATIQKKHPNLNETESKVMVLSCSDLSNKEIAGILGLSIHTVNKCRSGINRKII